MITSGGSNSSICPYSFTLKSTRSGPFSWTKSALASASARSEVKLRFACDAPAESPSRSSGAQALATNSRSRPSAPGAGSVATTCRPWARYSADQLAPMRPVPTMAMRRMGLVSDMVNLRWDESDFDVGDAGDVALADEEGALEAAIEGGDVERAGEVGEEHPAAGQVERQADGLHQVGDQDLRLGRPIDRSPVDRVAAWRVAAVGPVEDTALVFELQIDGLRQAVEQHLDVRAVRRALARGRLDVGAKDPAAAAFVGALLGPVELAPRRIDGDADAPLGLVALVGVGIARFDEGFELGAVEVAAHHAHALAVAPVELASDLIEVELLG